MDSHIKNFLPKNFNNIAPRIGRYILLYYYNIYLYFVTIHSCCSHSLYACTSFSGLKLVACQQAMTRHWYPMVQVIMELSAYINTAIQRTHKG